MVIQLCESSQTPSYHDIPYDLWFGDLTNSVTRNNVLSYSLTTKKMLTGQLSTMAINKCIAAHKIV